jgi:antitoxin VapB
MLLLLREPIMTQAFITRQFKAGNSQAVRIPSEMAFPPKTELLVIREGNRIIVEPREETLENVPALFAALKPHFDGKRPEFVETERDW